MVVLLSSSSLSLNSVELFSILIFSSLLLFLDEAVHSGVGDLSLLVFLLGTFVRLLPLLFFFFVLPSLLSLSSFQPSFVLSLFCNFFLLSLTCFLAHQCEDESRKVNSFPFLFSWSVSSLMLALLLSLRRFSAKRDS